MRDTRGPSGLAAIARSTPGALGLAVLGIMTLLCVLSLPYTLGSAGTAPDGQPMAPRYKHGSLTGALLPPTWAGFDNAERARFQALSRELARARLASDLARRHGAPVDDDSIPEPTPAQIQAAAPFHLLGTDSLGRDLLIRCLAGGGVSIGIGLAAAAVSVLIGTAWGMTAGLVGGRLDGLMMRGVDVLYGLPTLLLVVLLSVAADAALARYVSREDQRRAYVSDEQSKAPAAPDPAQGEVRRQRLEAEARERFPPRAVSPPARAAYELAVLLVAIGGVSWLTMSRVIRGQTLSLSARPFVEAARAMGTPPHRLVLHHMLPNLMGPIIVYATLTVPAAMLQESFLSFLGIGVRPPLPSWGNLASDALAELNPVRVRWWLLVFPCGLLALTLVALNFVGEGLRESFDPRGSRK